MKVLGVNGIRLVTPRSGVARYIEALLASWDELDHPFDEIRVYTPKPVAPDIELGRKGRNVVLPTRGPYGLWEQWHLPRAHGDAGVLFCPSYIAALRARCPVVLMHQGSYEGYPKAFTWWRRTKAFHAYRASARRADLVLTVSESSKRDILRFYRIDEGKIRVVPNGVDLERFTPIEDEARRRRIRESLLGTDQPYLLYVGKPIARHNIRTMLEGFADLVRRGVAADHRFVVIGTDLPGLDVAAIVDELDIGSHVTLIGHAGHDTVSDAMAAAEVLVYASDYEGFGMPVLEGMACGTPVLALDNTAIPEFATGAALLLPTGDAATLAEGMQRLLEDDALRQELRQAGPRRAAGYAWGPIARRHLDAFLSVA